MCISSRLRCCVERKSRRSYMDTDFDQSRGAERSPQRLSAVDELIATTRERLGVPGSRKPSPYRPAAVDTIAAVIIAILAVTVLLCLSAIAPVLWAFASDTGSHMRSELSGCL